jgi:hypothetical protein
MILVGAEHDRLLHSVRAFQVFRNLSGNLVCTVFDDDVVVKVTVGVNTVFNFFAVFVTLTLIRTPAFTNVGADINNPEGSKETVLNTLTETVSVYWLSEIINIGDIFCFFA